MKFPRRKRYGRTPPWRCRLGIHSPSLWDPHFSYDEPPDEWWYCDDCTKQVYPLSWRPGIWFWDESPFSETVSDWRYRWDKRRHPENYA